MLLECCLLRCADDQETDCWERSNGVNKGDADEDKGEYVDVEEFGEGDVGVEDKDIVTACTKIHTLWIHVRVW